MHSIVRKADGKWPGNWVIEHFNNLKDGDYIIIVLPCDPQSDIPTYRKVYFAKIDFLGKETGHTKYEMHELVKTHLLDNVSTKYLAREGWLMLLERLDLWAFQQYEVVLP